MPCYVLKHWQSQCHTGPGTATFLVRKSALRRWPAQTGCPVGLSHYFDAAIAWLESNCSDQWNCSDGIMCGKWGVWNASSVCHGLPSRPVHHATQPTTTASRAGLDGGWITVSVSALLGPVVTKAAWSPDPVPTSGTRSGPTGDICRCLLRLSADRSRGGPCLGCVRWCAARRVARRVVPQPLCEAPAAASSGGLPAPRYGR